MGVPVLSVVVEPGGGERLAAWAPWGGATWAAVVPVRNCQWAGAFAAGGVAWLF